MTRCHERHCWNSGNSRHVMLTSKATQELSAAVTPCLVFIVDLHLHQRVAPSPLDCWLSVRPLSRITSAAWGQPRSWNWTALNCRLFREATRGRPRSMLASVTFSASCIGLLAAGHGQTLREAHPKSARTFGANLGLPGITVLGQAVPKGLGECISILNLTETSQVIPIFLTTPRFEHQKGYGDFAGFRR